MCLKKILSLVLVLPYIFTLTIMIGCQQREPDNDVLPEVSPGIGSAALPEVSITQVPFNYESLEDLLADIVIANFSYPPRRSVSPLGGISELFVPRESPYPLIVIAFRHFEDSSIGFSYRESYRSAAFTWNRNIRATGESIHRHRTGPYDLGFRTEYRVSWSQHGYWFNAKIPSTFTEEEVYNFTYAKTLVAWEIQGNAISVSIQGMKNVSVFDERGYELTSEAITNDSLSHVFNSMEEHYVLYRSNGESLSRVGYSWLISANLQKHQYVLEPGIYTFHIEGVTGEPGLWVRHFEDRQIISTVDYSAELEQPFSELTITVKPITTIPRSILSLYE